MPPLSIVGLRYSPASTRQALTLEHVGVFGASSRYNQPTPVPKTIKKGGHADA
jgi:hypothetical protein